MGFKIKGYYSVKKRKEIEDAFEEFDKEYNLNQENITYIIKKQESALAPNYFLIYPESDKIEIKKLLPLKLNSSHLQNMLIDNEKQSTIRLNKRVERLFMVFKQNPNSLMN